MTAADDEPQLARLVEQVRAAAAAGRKLRIAGHGSKQHYGEPFDAALEPLEVGALRGIVAYEPSELVVTVRAGTPLVELEAALAERGQCLPFEPPRLPAGDGAPGGSVGGMVASGLAGPARAHVGGVRDYVLGASLIDGRGELLHFGGTVMKNVAGYDLARALAGSLGVLGVLVSVSLKVLPQPRASLTLAFDCSQDDAIRRVNGWAAQPLPLSASSWHAGRLLLRLSGAQAAVPEAAARLADTYAGQVLPGPDADAHWRGLRDQTHAFFTEAAADDGRALWRLAVAPTQPPLPGLDAEPLVEWGGGLRWLHSRLPAATLRALAAQAGGHATLVRAAPGHPARADGVFAEPGASLAAIHRRLKQALDPQGLFNPGRLYRWL
jgi:FAD/FMN-containing dehydrogenase